MDMIYDAMTEKVMRTLGYDDVFDGDILYDSISGLLVTVLRMNAGIYFKRKYIEKNFSKDFFEKYQ